MLRLSSKAAIFSKAPVGRVQSARAISYQGVEQKPSKEMSDEKVQKKYKKAFHVDQDNPIPPVEEPSFMHFQPQFNVRAFDNPLVLVTQF